MADVSDPKIQQGQHACCERVEFGIDWQLPAAYLDVRSDKSDANWLLLDYEVRKLWPLVSICRVA